MRRRSVLKAFLGGMVALGPPQALASGCSSEPRRTLVVVFLWGGCDGLNVLVPYREDAYYRSRPTIAIAPPGSGSGSALDLDGFFGLHPALEPFRQLFLEGRLALLPAVHYPNPSRSHFESQSIIDLVHPETGSGWLNRYLSDTARDGETGLVLGSVVPGALRGQAPVSTYGDLEDFRLSWSNKREHLLEQILADAYGAATHSPDPLLAALGATGVTLSRDLQEVRNLPVGDGALYPSGTFGRQLYQLAALLKDGRRPPVVAVGLGGWDTHSGQGGAVGRQAALLDLLARGVNAFLTDLGPAANDVIVLMHTEFGRTLAENGSGGTDHGHAATWVLAGGPVNGGIHLGPAGWPGLEQHQLIAERYLAHTVDFRDVYAALLSATGSCSEVQSIVSWTTPGMLDLFH